MKKNIFYTAAFKFDRKSVYLSNEIERDFIELIIFVIYGGKGKHTKNNF